MFVQSSFGEESIDFLARARNEKMNIDQIVESLNLQGNQADVLKTYFVEQTSNSALPDDDCSIRYFGHACILIKFKGIHIMIDPLIGYGHKSSVSKYTFHDLPDVIDYVLITHNHQDHIVLETLLQLRYKIKNIVIPRSNKGSIVDPSMKLILEKVGFKKIIELDEFENTFHQDICITGLPFYGEHADLCITSKMTYFIQLENFKCMFLADSNNIDPDFYHHIYGIYGSIDALFLGMECEGAPGSWIYGPVFPDPIPRDMDKSRRLNGSNCEKALSIVHIMKPKFVYVYAMGQEPWLSYLMGMNVHSDMPQMLEAQRFVKETNRRGIYAKKLYGCENIYFRQIYQEKKVVI